MKAKLRNLFNLSRSQWMGVAILASSLGVAGAVTIPNTFTAGTAISSGAMNNNFSTLAGALTTVEAAVTTLQSAVATLQSRMTSLQTVKPIVVTSVASGPGVDQNGICFNIASVTVNAPAAGQVTILGHATLETDKGFFSTDGFVDGSVFVDTTPSTCVGFEGRTFLPAALTDGSYQFTVPLTGQFTVSAGSNTFYVGKRTTATATAANGVFNVDTRVTAIYIPD